MTPLQKEQLKLSTSREAANDLAAKADRTPEEDQKLTELRNKHKELEKEYRTALEPTVEPRVTVRDGETREFDALLSRSTVGRVLTAALSQRSTDGAEAELQQYFGLAANQIALEQLETRAVTAGTFGRGIKSAAHYPGDFPGRRRFVLGRRNADCRSWGSNLHGFDHGCNRPHSGKEFRRRRNDGCFQCFGTVSQAGAGVIFLEHRGRGEAGGDGRCSEKQPDIGFE